ncbi:dnaJ-like protein 60 [Lineus longissimus]|uniref:dnaJ-like protein 60 n=1 Tax=Lineus longissimus TaxID=88925 RepID=UPI002B4EA8BA
MLKELADVIICRPCLLQRQLYQSQFIFLRKKHFNKSSTHYDVLGVKNDASAEEIRHAFVNLSKVHHPDKTDDEDTSKFVRIHKAYTILSKMPSRREYDFTLNEVLRRRMMMQSMMNSHHHGSQPTPGSGAASSSDDNPQVFWDESIYSMRDKSKDRMHQNASYYGFRGFQKQPNSYIVLGCCLIIIFGAAVHLLVINTSSQKTRKKLDARDKMLHGMYKESKQKAIDHGNALQLQLLTSRVAQNKKLTGASKGAD